jgi:3-oxoacyl-[acyl-carrier protein] reductase
MTQVMLITGTSRGIGKALAEYYLARDWEVVGCARGEVELTHSRYTHLIADVSDEVAVKQIFTTIQRRFERLDVLINNAGRASMNHAVLTTLTTFQGLLSANLIGTFLCSREASKLMMRQHNGRIVNFSTVAVPLKLAGEAAYVASKAGVEALTQVFAKELGTTGITVNAVGPTPIATDLIRNVPAEKIHELLKQQPLARLGTFEDITNVIDFFIAPNSNFITGQVIYLGGVA